MIVIPFQIDQKQLLSESLIFLSCNSSIDKITIQEIVNRCGVSRSTFYRYFKDKYELLAYTFENEMLNIEQHAADKGLTFYEFAVEIGYMIREKKDFYRSAFSYEGQNSFFDSVCESAQKAFRSKCIRVAEEAGEKLDPCVMDYLSLGYGAAATMIYRHWVMYGMEETPEEIAGIIYESCPEIYKGYI